MANQDALELPSYCYTESRHYVNGYEAFEAGEPRAAACYSSNKTSNEDWARGYDAAAGKAA